MAGVHVTEAEGELLEVLWRSGPLPPSRLIAEVMAVRPWQRATIKTLLARLKQKAAIRSEREDGVLRYRALIDRSAFVESEVRALIERLFDGDVAAMAAFLAERLGVGLDAGELAGEAAGHGDILVGEVGGDV